MRYGIILAGVAALAVASAAPAQPDKGKGGGGGGKQAGGPAKAERGGGGQKQARGQGGEQRGAPQVARKEQGGAKQRGPSAGQRPTEQKQQRQVERKQQRQAAVEQGRGKDRAKPAQSREVRGAARMDNTRDRSDIRSVQYKRGSRQFASPAFRSTGLLDGCPPGLAAKNNGCLPPGQAKKLVGLAAPATLGSALLPSLYRSWYPDNQDYFYRTDDNYVYRIDRDDNLVNGFFPLYDDYSGAYSVGATYPRDYLDTYNVPVQYQSWYADTDEDYYRYGDGSIYRVDRQGGVIEGIVSLLAGDLALGQPLPAGYDAYNVPSAYRDRYADTPDSMYRYNDGNIYEVDPTTRLVQAIVETLT